MKVRNIEKIIEMHKEKNIPFHLEQTMFKKKLTSELGFYEWVGKSLELKKRDLSFIGVVKNYCERNIKPFSFDRKNIQYIRPSALKQSYYMKKKVFEIDLTGAYWEFAFEEKHISVPIYERGLTVDKKVRLIALGNLAKRTAHLDFDGTNFSKPNFERSIKTENIFFHCSYLTDLLMKKLIVIANTDFLFYWVDAIFVKGEKAKNEIIEFLELNGTKYKSYQMNSIIKHKNKIITCDDKHETEENPKGMRTFNFRKRETFISIIKKEVKEKNIDIEEMNKIISEKTVKPKIENDIGIQDKLFDVEISDGIQEKERGRKGKIKYQMFFKNNWTEKEFDIFYHYSSDMEMIKKSKEQYHQCKLLEAYKFKGGEKIKVEINELR